MVRAPFALSLIALVACLAPSTVLAQATSAAQFTDAAAAAPAADSDDTVWQVQLGGTLNYGNARSFQLSVNNHFLIRRDIHMFTLDLTFLYGIASLRDAGTQQFGPWNTNAQNLTGLIRYDIFLDPDDGLFATVRGRNDPFAGLDFRFQGQLGYMRNLLREHEDQHRLWVEIGADVTYDDRYPNPLCGAGGMGVTVDPATCTGTDGHSYLLPGDELQPSARLYVGYDNHMNSDWTYRTGVEGLIDLRGEPHWRNVRINWSNAFTLTIATNLGVSLTFNFMWDGEPVPGREEIDTQTILGLTYTLL